MMSTKPELTPGEKKGLLIFNSVIVAWLLAGIFNIYK
jgi:hypothetical protein